MRKPKSGRAISCVLLAALLSSIGAHAAVSASKQPVQIQPVSAAADTQADARRQGAVNIGSINWVCSGARCSTSIMPSAIAAPLPLCQALAREVGAIRSFTLANRTLSGNELQQCNSAAPAVAATMPGMKTPAAPVPGVALPLMQTPPLLNKAPVTSLTPPPRLMSDLAKKPSVTGDDYKVRGGEDNKSNIQFGDGERGRRLPSGKNDASATYRAGNGVHGELKPGTNPQVTDRINGKEANRKASPYPENWIEPDNRAGKSPVFEDMRDDLQKGDQVASAKKPTATNQAPTKSGGGFGSKVASMPTIPYPAKKPSAAKGSIQTRVQGDGDASSPPPTGTAAPTPAAPRSYPVSVRTVGLTVTGTGGLTLELPFTSKSIRTETMSVTGTGQVTVDIPFTAKGIRTEGLSVTGTGSVH